MARQKRLCSENKRMQELFHIRKADLTTYSKKQDAEIHRLYGILKNKPKLRMILLDLACGHHWIDDRKRDLVDDQKICWVWTHSHSAALAGEDYSNHVSGPLLQEIKYRGIISDLGWYSHDIGEHQARVIYSCTIPEALKKILHTDIFDEDRVLIRSRRKASEQKIIEADKHLLVTRKGIKRAYWQLDYFDECLRFVPIETYLELRRKNGVATVKMAQAAGDQQQIALAKALYDKPRPYGLETVTENDLLARYYVSDHGTIKSALRRRFYQGCTELDAQNAHFSFLAMKFPHLMPETTRFLAEALKQDGLSIWSTVLDHLCVPGEQRTEAKEMIKPITYSIQYGREANYAESLLFKQMRGNIFWRGSYLDCIYIKELVAATKQCMDDIEKYGGMQGAFGWIKWDRSKMDKKSFMANVFQTYEIALMYPLYELLTEQKAMRDQTFQILLHQHDGVTVQFNTGREEETIEKMNERFNRARDKYGITTKLTTKR